MKLFAEKHLTPFLYDLKTVEWPTSQKEMIKQPNTNFLITSFLLSDEFIFNLIFCNLCYSRFCSIKPAKTQQDFHSTRSIKLWFAEVWASPALTIRVTVITHPSCSKKYHYLMLNVKNYCKLCICAPIYWSICRSRSPLYKISALSHFSFKQRGKVRIVFLI